MIRKFGGSSGIDSQPAGIDLGIGGSNIKSKQSGTVDIAGLTTKDITISAVDLSKSIVRVVFGGNAQAGMLNSVLVSAWFINSTTIRVYRYTSSSDTTQPIYWEVVEFNNVKSKQTGELICAAPTTDITISPVNLSKTMLFYYLWSQSTGYFINNARLGGYLTSQTNLQFSGYAPQNNYIVADWQLLEFN